MYIPFPRTDIYCLTDSRQSLGRSSLDVVKAMLEGGAKVIQYREKDKSGGRMLEECLAIRAETRKAGCCFLVNDHVDVALLCDADGVHLGQDDLPLGEVRSLLGRDRVIGISTRSRTETEAAIAGGADYIGVGAMYPTATKRDTHVVGIACLGELAAQCPIPFAVIGGVNEQTLPELVRCGARCFAIVSAITLAEDIPAKMAELRAIIRRSGHA